MLKHQNESNNCWRFLAILICARVFGLIAVNLGHSKSQFQHFEIPTPTPVTCTINLKVWKPLPLQSSSPTTQYSQIPSSSTPLFSSSSPSSSLTLVVRVFLGALFLTRPLKTPKKHNQLVQVSQNQIKEIYHTISLLPISLLPMRNSRKSNRSRSSLLSLRLHSLNTLLELAEIALDGIVGCAVAEELGDAVVVDLFCAC